jgi:hypothetical protein
MPASVTETGVDVALAIVAATTLRESTWPPASASDNAKVSFPGGATIENVHVRSPSATAQPGELGVSPYVDGAAPFTATASTELEGDT